MKRNFILFGVIILLAFSLVGCSNFSSQESQSNSSSENVKDHQLIEIRVGQSDLNVEAVNSLESITEGLGNRDEIGSDGMLFFLPDRRIATFWMKGMRFDLDMVWIDEDKVIGITTNAPSIKNPGDQLQTYSSPAQVNFVLELPAGDAQKRGISTGDTVIISP